VVLGSRVDLPCDQNCSVGIQVVNTTWIKSPGDVYVTSGDREELVIASTANSSSGLYSRWQYIQHVGECLTGVYSLTVLHSFCEFINAYYSALSE